MKTKQKQEGSRSFGKTTKLFVLITECLGYRFLMAKILAGGIGYSNSLSLIHVFSNSKTHTFLYFDIFETGLLFKIHDITQLN